MSKYQIVVLGAGLQGPCAAAFQRQQPRRVLMLQLAEGDSMGFTINAKSVTSQGFLHK